MTKTQILKAFDLAIKNAEAAESAGQQAEAAVWKREAGRQMQKLEIK
jgi:hypothetical protein